MGNKLTVDKVKDIRWLTPLPVEEDGAAEEADDEPSEPESGAQPEKISIPNERQIGSSANGRSQLGMFE